MLDSLEFTPQDGVTYDCAGLYGGICGVPAPEWRHKLDTTWRTPWAGVDLTLSWRYFGEVEARCRGLERVPVVPRHGDRAAADRLAAGQPQLHRPDGLGARCADKYTLRVGVNNLFDKDPPLNGRSTCPTGPCNGNTWPQMYDALGRQIFGLVTIDF